MNQTDNMKNVSNSKENNLQADVVIVGTGVGGCFSALNLSEDLSIIMITKSDLESSDSFLAQGGICVLHDDDDYDSYFEDTMRAGHYENRKESVDIMIRGSQDVIHDLIGYGVDLQRKMVNFCTQEKAPIPDLEFCFMKILLVKKSQVSFLHR